MDSDQNRRNFDEVLSEAIDQALTSIGESVKNILYYHIQTKYFLKPEDISKNPDLFVLALKSLLGKGSSHLEELILKKVCEAYKLDWGSLVNDKFEESIKLIRQKISNSELQKSC
jgi:hypothetical protein